MPKAKIPNTKVFKGVSEFKMELTELLICVCAMAKRKAGTNVPKTEVSAMNFHWCCGILAKLLKPIIKRKTAAKIIRSEPT